MKIADDTVVSIHYTLTDDSGAVIDRSDAGQPLSYLQGHQNIIPGLEEALRGKSVGDKFNVSIPPENGYGRRDDSLLRVVPRDAFTGIDDIQPGMQFQAETDQGVHLFTVDKVEGDKITLDGNHPLAGVTLTFDIEVAAVRKATTEELSHGHVHGAGGHPH